VVSLGDARLRSDRSQRSAASSPAGAASRSSTVRSSASFWHGSTARSLTNAFAAAVPAPLADLRWRRSTSRASSAPLQSNATSPLPLEEVGLADDSSSVGRQADEHDGDCESVGSSAWQPMSDIFGQVPQDEPPLPQLVEDPGEQREQVASSPHRSNNGADMSLNRDEAAQTGANEGPNLAGDEPPPRPVEEAPTVVQEAGADNTPLVAGDAEVAAHEEIPPDENWDEAGEWREPELHLHVSCDGCGSGPPLLGSVMKCVQCDDFDLCGPCYRDRLQIGHPASHTFRARVPSEGGRSLSAMENALMRLFALEADLLQEVMRHDADAQRAQQQARAEEEAMKVLSGLRRVPWEAPKVAENEAEECSLCLEEFKEGEELLQLPCHHLFHENCIAPWFRRSLTCPLCKHQLS